MTELTRAKEPFKFYTRLHLTESTGLKASNVDQLLAHIQEVPGSCIYHHTHRFFQEFQSLAPLRSNDFAHWIITTLGETRLGEELESIDIIQFSTIRDLREKIRTVIATYVQNNPQARLRFAARAEEFYFLKTISFIIPTGYAAYDLKEFRDAMDKISVDSLYFHMFEARLRLEKSTTDLSNWLETALGEKTAAEKISRLDPYSYSLEDLRKAIIRILERRLTS